MKTRNRNKHSALHFSAANGNIEIASVLLKSLNSSDKCSLISSPENNGVTAFSWSCLKGYFEIIKWLLENHKNCMSEPDPLLLEIQDNDGNTPLMQAVLSHYLEIVSWLVSIGPDCVKRQNKNKRNVLHYAAANNNTEIASVLLKALKSSENFH